MDSAAVNPPRSVHLKAIDASPETFADFGQVISSSPDGEVFGPNDAQLDLHRGTPRFYIMHLQDRHQLKFGSITHHASVTQCLGSVGAQEWFLGVAKATIVHHPTNIITDDDSAVKSASGHYYVPPNPNDVRVFRVIGPKFLKLNVGTWHAGPLFTPKAMDFYNLELSNTNALGWHAIACQPVQPLTYYHKRYSILSASTQLVVDHTTHSFRKKDGVIFVVEE